MIYPNFIKKGDTIGVPAPSDGAYDEKSKIRFQNSKRNFENLGYKIIESKNLLNSNMGRSASYIERANELNEMFENSQINMIMCAAGGDFLLEILPYLNFEKLKENPKFVQGFSDPTSLIYVITTKYDIATIYSINFKSFGMEIWEQDLKNNMEIITGNVIVQNSFPLYEDGFIEKETGLEGYTLTKEVNWKILEGENAKFKGRIIGGCLDCISNIAGTKYDGGPDFAKRYKDDGIIWYFDDFALSNEEIIRTLWKFNELGYFENVKGFIFGRVCMESTYCGYSLEQALRDSVISKLNVPIIYDADISHKSPSFTIINGAIAEVSVESGKGQVKLDLD